MFSDAFRASQHAVLLKYRSACCNEFELLASEYTRHIISICFFFFA